MNCYVLAGGRSSRMGQSKSDLFLGSIAARAVAVFDEVVAVQRAGGAPLAIRTIFEPPHEHEAPVFGVLRALEEARGKCFILAVDYPLITSELLRFLRDACERSSAPLVVPVWNGTPQVLCAGYSAELVPRLEARVARGELDLRGLMDAADVIDEQVLRARFKGEPLLNANTPADLAGIP